MVSDGQAELNRESAVAELSVFDPNNPVDLAQYEGDLISKQVTITTRGKTPDDQELNQTMVVAMQQVHLTGTDGGDLEGRWIITGLGPP